jgi:hypothetical protein
VTVSGSCCFRFRLQSKERAGVLKKTTNEQRLMRARPSDRWMKIGVGVLLIKHKTFQSLINLFSPRLLASGGGGGISSNFRIIATEERYTREETPGKLCHADIFSLFTIENYINSVFY